jgi:hypothetical protein
MQNMERVLQLSEAETDDIRLNSLLQHSTEHGFVNVLRKGLHFLYMHCLDKDSITCVDAKKALADTEPFLTRKQPEMMAGPRETSFVARIFPGEKTNSEVLTLLSILEGAGAYPAARPRRPVVLA